MEMLARVEIPGTLAQEWTAPTNVNVCILFRKLQVLTLKGKKWVVK